MSALPPKSGHSAAQNKCPLRARRGHRRYSITTLAVASSDGGTVRPSALAVLRLFDDFVSDRK